MVRLKEVMFAVTVEHKSMKPTSSYKCQPEKNLSLSSYCVLVNTHILYNVIRHLCMQPK